jgi:heme-degrading monooxygenase HmoA
MYLVVFRNRTRADTDASSYSADAAAMPVLAARQPGFVSFKSYAAEDGEVVALSEWVDEASARAWGQVEEHRGIQKKGRAEYYADYTLFACDDPRIHRFESKA